MAKAKYLHPEIVNGRANGRFHFVSVELGGGPAGTGALKQRGGQGIVVAIAASAMLWAGIAALVF